MKHKDKERIQCQIYNRGYYYCLERSSAVTKCPENSGTNVITDRNGNKKDLKDYEGKVLIIVNTATGCGFTPQYEGLEKLYKEYHDKGLEIIDIPCNQFGNQAPGTDDEIHEFCALKYNTSFDQFTKADVNGENELPLYTYLKKEIKEDTINGIKNKMAMKAIEKISKAKDGDIKWNFTKFLVDRKGEVVGRYSPTYNPVDMEEKIKEII